MRSHAIEVSRQGIKVSRQDIQNLRRLEDPAFIFDDTKDMLTIVGQRNVDIALIYYSHITMKVDSQAGKAYSEIRKKILTNQIQPGIRLKEDVWSKNIGVGRMAIREALTRLLGENLLVQGEKGGYYIKPMTQTDVQELRELREILEIGALKLSYKKITPVQIKKLEQICDDFTAMIKQGYFSGACEADIRFHETLIEISNNQKLLTAYRTSHIPLFHQKLSRSQETLNDYELTDKEHRGIVKALKIKDYKQAEQTLIRHFLRGESAVLDLG